MPRIKILNNNDIKTFENPPQFNGEERKQFFYLPNWAKALVESFRTPTNQVGFVLQLGYFKVSNKFFVARKFHQKDIEFIAKRFGFQLNELDFDSYTRGLKPSGTKRGMEPIPAKLCSTWAKIA